MSKLKKIIAEKILSHPLQPSQYSLALEKMAQRRIKSVLAGTAKSSTPYGLLFKNEKGQWRIRETNREEKEITIQDTVPNGSYVFVRTELGFIRVRPLNSGEATHHRALSDHAKQVRYAGILHFTLNEQGEAVLVKWVNDSGSYRPQSHLSFLAGLPIESFSTFDKYTVSPPSPTPISPVAANAVESFDLSPVNENYKSNTALFYSAFFKQETHTQQQQLPAVPQAAAMVACAV